MKDHTSHPVQSWHDLLRAPSPSALNDILAEDVVFHSPVVHRPQKGRALTAMYLSGALKVLFNDHFHYVREIVGEQHAALEFRTRIDDIEINGVDLIRWNDAGLIDDFKVMLRPLKAIQIVQLKMAELLAQMGSDG